MIRKCKKLTSILTALAVVANFLVPATHVKAIEKNAPISTELNVTNEDATANQGESKENAEKEASTIQILATTDTHGKFKNYDYALNKPDFGGMTQIAAAIKEEKAKNPNTLVVDNGDTIQGNYNHIFLKEDYLSENTDPMILALKKIGYDTYTLGNHEFNFGMKTLNTIIGQAEEGNVTVLCGNLYKDGKRVFRPYTVKEVNGVRVAIIGVVAPNIVNWDAENLKEYTTTDPSEEVKKIISEIKSKDKADVFVVSAHMGIDSEYGRGDSATDIANLNPEVSVIIAGHSHQSHAEEEVNGVLITQPKNLGKEVSKVELNVEKEAGKVTIKNKKSSLIKLDKNSPEDPELSAALEKYNQDALNDGKRKIGELVGPDLAEADEVKGICQSYVTPQGVTDFLNEVQLYYANKALEAKGIDTSKIHHIAGSAMLSNTANLKTGDISKSDIANIYKFDNKLYTIKTTGKQIKKYLEWTSGIFDTFKDGDLTISINPDFRGYLYDTLTGVNYSLNISKEIGSRVESLTYLDGSEVKDTDEVYLTVNNYRLDSCLASRFDKGSYEKIYDSTNESLSDIRDMVADYIQNVKHGVISRHVDNNWKLTGVKYDNLALRSKVVELINNGKVTYKTNLKVNDVKKELQSKGLTAELEEINKLEGNKAENSKTIDVLSFNDFHGNALESGKNVGAAKLAGVINSYKDKENDNYGVIAVSGGDLYQGSAISNLLEGAPETAMLKAMGIAASAIGNHEFDWGREHLKTWSKEGGFPFLAANMVKKGTEEVSEYAKPYIIVEKNGVKVAFIGIATPETLTTTKASNVEGLDFLDPTETLNKYSKIVKAEGADVVIALTHSSSYQDSKTQEITGEGAEIAKNVTGVDAIVTAHSHKFVSGKVNGIPIVQAGYNGRGLSKLTMSFDKDNKLVDIVPETTQFAKIQKELPVDKNVEAIMSSLEKQLQPIFGQKVTTLEERLNNDDKYSNLTDLGVVVSETIRQVVGTQIAINNGGGIRRSLEKGDVTVGDMYEILPFDNTIIRLNLKGSDLVKVIEHGIKPESVGWGQFAGIKVFYNEETGKVNSMKLIDGTPIDMDKYYSVAINDFMLTGGDGYDFSAAKDVENTNVVMRDSVTEYWQKHGIPQGDYKLLVAGEDTNYIPDGTEDPTDPGKAEDPSNPGNPENPSTPGSGTVVEPGSNVDEVPVIDEVPADNNTIAASAKTSDNSQIEIMSLIILMAIATSAIYASQRRKKENA
ncbi:MAG: 2',3'-cyclic-nucleotide 2'-phosphodiesterase [Clostridium sp.]|nr:2',3'-cyclic-nucleotide 2'-phosphodiesterase [Clostridium sp.]